jgi:hypothetical protein
MTRGWGETLSALYHWWFYGLFFGALPYLLSVAVNLIRDPARSPFENSPELLFLVIAAAATALGEVHDYARTEVPRLRDNFHRVTISILVVGLIAAAFLYGLYVYHDATAPTAAVGLDCASVVKHLEAATETLSDTDADRLIHRWGTECTTWHQLQSRLFKTSVAMALFFSVVSTVAIGLYSPSRRNG